MIPRETMVGKPTPVTPAHAFVHDCCLLQDRNNGNRNRTNPRHG